MKRFNFKRLLIFIILIIFISFLKKGLLSDNNILYVLVNWQDDIVINIIWVLSIMLIQNYINIKYYPKFISFNVRNKSRKKYIIILNIKYILYSIFILSISSILEYILISLFLDNKIIFSLDLIKYLIIYIFDNIAINYIIIYFFLISSNYIYSYIITFILLLLFKTLNIEQIIKIYIPLISLYYFNLKTYNSLIIIIIFILLIIKKYISMDIRGDDE